MKNIVVAIALILFVPVIGTSQKMSDEFDLKWGDVALHKSKDSHIMDAFFANGQYYVLRKEVIRGPGGWHYFLEQFDQGLNRTEVKDISANIDEENYRTYAFQKIGENYVILSSNFNKRDRRESFFLQRLDTENMQMSKRKTLKVFEDVKRPGRNYPRSIKSDDNGFMAIYFTEYRRKEEVNLFHCFVFDETTEIVWKRENYDISSQGVGQVFIDEEATVSIVGGGDLSDSYFSGQSVSSAINILLLSEDDEETIAYGFEDYTPEGLAVSKTDEGHFQISGYYSDLRSETDGQKYYPIEGAFCVTIDGESGSPIDDLKVEFSDDLLKEGESARTQKKQDKKADKGKPTGSSNLKMQEIIYHDDGSFTMIGEERWLVVTTTTDANGNVSTRYTYHEGDMIITTIQDGEITSNIKVNKHISGGRPITAYQAISYDNATYLFFLDDRQNLISIDPKDGVLSANGKNKDKAFTVVKIYEGKKSREGIIDYGTKQYEPYRALRTDSDVFVLDNKDILCWVYKGKKQFALLRIRHK